MRTICFLSDYGEQDTFAGTCRGVIKRINPGAPIIDVTHGIPPHDVFAGAVALRDTLPYMPPRAVHLAVVDPGVGSERPVAAVLAAGAGLARAGRPFDPSTLVRLGLPGPRVTDGGLVAVVIQIDRFGNLALDLTAAELRAARLRGDVEILCGGRRRCVAGVAATFSDVPHGSVALLVDSFGHVAICENGGSAARRLALGVGDVVGLARLVPRR